MLISVLTLLFTMFPFNLLENIRKHQKTSENVRKRGSKWNIGKKELMNKLQKKIQIIISSKFVKNVWDKTTQEKVTSQSTSK